MNSKVFSSVGIKGLEINADKAEVHFIQRRGTKDITVSFEGEFISKPCEVKNDTLFINAKCRSFILLKGAIPPKINIFIPEEFLGNYTLISASAVYSEMNKIKSFQFVNGNIKFKKFSFRTISCESFKINADIENLDVSISEVGTCEIQPYSVVNLDDTMIVRFECESFMSVNISAYSTWLSSIDFYSISPKVENSTNSLGYIAEKNSTVHGTTPNSIAKLYAKSHVSNIFVADISQKE